MNKTFKNNSFWYKCHYFLQTKCRLKKSNIDYLYPYNFKIFAWKDTGFIFVLTALVIPFLLDAIFKLAFINSDLNSKTSSTIDLFRTVIRLISIGLGLVYIWNRKRNELIQTGTIAFYIFALIPTLFAFLISFSVLLFLPSSIAKNTTFNLVLNIAADCLVLVLILNISPIFINKIKTTFKENKKTYLSFIWFFIAGAIGLNFLFGYFQSLITTSISQNQQSLNEGLKDWYNTILLIILSVFIAPFVEEFATRHGIFQLCGNPYIGFITSFLFFSQMHISAANDWQHLISYFGGALALTITFSVFRYNVAASWLVHTGLNTVAVIVNIASR